MHNFLVSEKIIEGKKINVSKKSKKPASAEASAGKPAEATTPATAAAATAVEVKPVEAPKDMPAQAGEGPKQTPPAV